MSKTVKPLGLMLLAAALALGGCSGKSKKQPAPEKSKPPAKVFKQSSQDGAPWWDKDVSQIPDAAPRPHNGPFKAAPYTVLGKTYYPIQTAKGYAETGTASWYGTKFHGLKTANGEDYDLYGMTAAHKTLPLPSYVKVTNIDNGRSVTLRVNDRGPFYSDRIIDLSFAAAKKLGYAESGVAQVRVEGIDTGVSAGVVTSQPAQVYTPPSTQHAGALLPIQVEPTRPQPVKGIYLQAGAFANPDAAQLLTDKLGRLVQASVGMTSVVQGGQVLHRVRIGPLDSQMQAETIQQQVAAAGLGTPGLVHQD